MFDSRGWLLDTPYVMLEVDRVVSTQDRAAEALEETGRSALVVAAHQTGGRGRYGAEWWEPDRALLASLAFHPAWPPERWWIIPLVAGLAVRQAVFETFAVTTMLKWPNDVFTPQGKVGGILTEATEERVVVGCGLNLWWADPREGAAGVLPADPGHEVVAPLARLWADHLQHRLTGPPEAWGHDEYRKACWTLGTEIVWEPEGRGVAIDIAPDGGLIVQTATGKQVLRSGAVRSVRAATLPGRRAAMGDEEQR